MSSNNIINSNNTSDETKRNQAQFYRLCEVGNLNGALEFLEANAVQANHQSSSSSTTTVQRDQFINQSYPGAKGNTPLIAATEKGHEEIVRFLLENEADVNKVNEVGETAIFHAAKKGFFSIAQLLIVEYGANIHMASFGRPRKTGRETPLHEASMYGYTDVVRLLLDHGADVNQPCTDGETPLSLSCADGHIVTVQELLRYGADPNAIIDGDDTALIAAIEELEEEGGIVAEMVLLLLSNGANPNLADKHGETPLLCATRNGQLRVIRTLLENGANVNLFSATMGETPWLRALNDNRDDIFELMKDHIDDRFVGPNGDTLLHALLRCCAAKGFSFSSYDYLSVLLETRDDIDIHAVNKDGKTPFFVAAEYGMIKEAKIFLSRGAAPDTMDSMGKTPLIIAAERGHADIVHLLLTHGILFLTI